MKSWLKQNNLYWWGLYLWGLYFLIHLFPMDVFCRCCSMNYLDRHIQNYCSTIFLNKIRTLNPLACFIKFKKKINFLFLKIHTGKKAVWLSFSCLWEHNSTKRTYLKRICLTAYVASVFSFHSFWASSDQSFWVPYCMYVCLLRWEKLSTVWYVKQVFQNLHFQITAA